MKCDKCGCEYTEGRNCPKCGALSIFLNEDYIERKKKWEEENAAQVLQNTSGKTKKKIKINKKKAIKGIKFLVCGAAVCIGIALAAAGIRSCIRVNNVKISYEEEYEEPVYTTDKVYICEKNIHAILSGTVHEEYASTNGRFMAVTVYDEGTEEYGLYVADKENTRLCGKGLGEKFILWVNNNGSVVYNEVEYAAYNAVSESFLCIWNEGNVYQVSDNFYRCIDVCDEWIVYDDMGGNVYIYYYGDNSPQLLYEGRLLNRYVYSNGTLYYADNSNNLYYIKDGSSILLVQGVYPDTLRKIYNGEGITYVKTDDSLCSINRVDKGENVLETAFDTEDYNEVVIWYKGKLYYSGKVYLRQR